MSAKFPRGGGAGPFLARSLYVVGHVMVLYSPESTNIGFSFILLTVNLFRHPTLIQHGLYSDILLKKHKLHLFC